MPVCFCFVFVFVFLLLFFVVVVVFVCFFSFFLFLFFFFFQKKESTPLPNFDDRQFLQELSTINVTEENISKAIDRIKSTKSQGPDHIHPMLIKECKNALLNSLKLIFEK